MEALRAPQHLQGCTQYSQQRKGENGHLHGIPCVPPHPPPRGGTLLVVSATTRSSGQEAVTGEEPVLDGLWSSLLLVVAPQGG